MAEMILTQQKRLTFLLRSACAMVILLTIVLFLAAIPARFSQLSHIATQLDVQSGTLGPPEALALERLGISVTTYAAYITTVESLTALIGILVGTVIFWRRGNDRMALFVTLALVTLGTFTSPMMTSLAMKSLFWKAPLSILQFIALGPSFLIFYLFPDGRFVPRWTRWIGMAWLAYTGSWLVFPDLKPPITLFAVSTLSPLVLWLVNVFIVMGVIAQIYRYRHYASQTQRQQTKWIVFGFSLTLIVLLVVGVFVRFNLLDTQTPLGMLNLLVGITVILAAFAISPITVMISILQYRLWDIDLIIRRTLSYAILSGLLALVYFVGVVGLQSLFSFLTQQNSTISIILSTLAIAVLFTPLRTRIQRFIDRRFYRKDYDARRALAQFAAIARDEVDLERLTVALLDVVNETMQPERISLWLQKKT
jgi:hypothetical protein